MNRNTLVDILFILVGNFLLALSVTAFILPYDILSGGVAGIAVALSPFINLDKTIMVNILVIVLFVVGWIFLGNKFAAQTFLSSLIYPIFLSVLSKCMPVIEVDPLVASLYGGIIGGFGIGMVLRRGASTGGMDVPPLIINKFTGIKLASLVMIIDSLTVLLGLFSFGIEKVLIGLISVYSCSFAIDKLLVFGGNISKSVQIISKNYEALLEIIHQKLNRGTTVSDIYGGYTGTMRKMILVVVSQSEYPELIDTINSVDKEAFVITTDATSVHGEGFSFRAKV